MSHTKTQYQQRLANMLPPGIDWLTVDPRVTRLLSGLGAVGARVDTDVSTFERDTVPTRSQDDALATWEDALALPDLDRPAVDPSDMAARQEAVRAALDQSATARTDLFVVLADVWGVTARADEPDSNPCEVWVYGPPEHVVVFRAGSHAGDHVKTMSATWAHIEALILRYMPAHVRAHFVDEVGA